MGFFDEDDQINARRPRDMHILVNTIAAIGEDGSPKRGFIATHLAQKEGDPSILMSLWVTSEYVEESEEHEFNLNDWLLEYTMPISPQQARALAFGLLRLAEGLEIEVERGHYGDKTLSDHSIYLRDPLL